MSVRRHPVLTGLAVVVVGAIVIAGIVAFWPARKPREIPSPTADAQLIRRGEYIATAADCVACHTAPGGAEYTGGRAFKLPFGSIIAPNITPDTQTGLGQWTTGEFVRALREGVGRHGEELYPAFPYTSYAKMSEPDAIALWAYLKTLAPVRHETAQSDLRFPFDQRRIMRFWKALFLDRESLQQVAGRGEEWNRGRYLVDALGHCGECHTPRNLLYGQERGRALAGETVQGWTAWNITADRVHGIGEWSQAELRDYLKTGYAPGRAVASGPMAEAIHFSLSRLEDADLGAIAAYLANVQPVARGPALVARAEPSANAAQPEVDPEGRRVFEGACMGCHLETGEGRQTAAASLLGRRSVLDPEGLNVMQVILHGNQLDLPAEHAMMPAFANAYSDAEIASATQFVLARFGAVNAKVSAKDVHAARDD
jgi:mono/diheme cytochrome c family protein